MSTFEKMTRGELRDLLRSRGHKVSVTASAETLREKAVELGIRPPFDREERDALKPRPIALVEHPAGARNRRQRRWSQAERRTDSGIATITKRVPKRFQRKARMEPATRLQLDIARGKVARGELS